MPALYLHYYVVLRLIIYLKFLDQTTANSSFVLKEAEKKEKDTAGAHNKPVKTHKERERERKVTRCNKTSFLSSITE